MEPNNSPEGIQQLHDFLKEFRELDPQDMKSYIDINLNYDAYIESFFIHFPDIDVESAFIELQETGKIHFYMSPDDESHIVKIKVND